MTVASKLVQKVVKWVGRLLDPVREVFEWVPWGDGKNYAQIVGSILLPPKVIITVREVIRSSYVDVRDVQGRRGLAVDIAA